MGREHTNRDYEQELRKLREQILLMGAKVEESITSSIRALTERDTTLAERMIAFDRNVNQMEVDIDGLCMQVLARRQPVASDLRFITMALKLVTDLERIGDLGVNMCERVIERDANIDAYYQQIFRELLTYMMEDPRNIFRATRLQSIAKYLERIGDHATNVGELVVFMVKGKDIRHAGKLGDGG